MLFCLKVVAGSEPNYKQPPPNPYYYKMTFETDFSNINSVTQHFMNIISN